MNKQTETALKMAKQHIIERKGGRGGAVCYVKSDEEVIKAIDEALAQPAQEYLTRAQQVIRANNSAQEPVPLIRHENGNFSPAPSWQGLSDDDMSIIFDKFDWKEVEIAGEHLDLFKFARAIEQALKEKNER